MRLTTLLGFISVTLVVAACGGDDGGNADASSDASGNGGFPIPTDVTKANSDSSGVWTELGDADWSCLNTPSPDQPSTQNIALSGRINDFQTPGNGVGDAAIIAFPGIQLTGNSGATTSDGAAATKGNYSMTLAQLPAGETRYGFKIDATGYVRTYLLNQYFDPANGTQTRNISAVSESTAVALPAFIGVNRDPAKGVLAGAFRDCAGNEVSNAVATVSSTAGSVNHLPGAQTFYFSAGSTSLPVRHNVSPTMNKDGLFVILELEPQAAPAYIQVWGFRTQAELTAGTLTLLSELASPIEANAIITGSFDPLRQ